MTVQTEYDFGDILYFKNDPDQDAYMVTGFIIRKGQIIYFMSICGVEKSAYSFELSEEKTLQL